MRAMLGRLSSLWHSMTSRPRHEAGREKIRYSEKYRRMPSASMNVASASWEAHSWAASGGRMPGISLPQLGLDDCGEAVDCLGGGLLFARFDHHSHERLGA